MGFAPFAEVEGDGMKVLKQITLTLTLTLTPTLTLTLTLTLPLSRWRTCTRSPA